MDRRRGYAKVLVLGSGKLAHQCALASREQMENVEVLEYKVTESTVLQRMCRRDRLAYQCCDKAQMLSRLVREGERSLVVSAGSTFLISEEVIEKKNLTIVNWHNALLPAHKGRNAEAWSIYEGDAVTGVTWHMISPQIDGGDIIAQKAIPLEDTMTALELYQRQCDIGLVAFREILPPLLEDRCAPWKQRESEAAVLHFSWEIPNGGYLDLGWNFRKTSSFLRAMDYGALRLLGDMHVFWEGRCYRFHKYRIVQKDAEEVFWERDGHCFPEDREVRSRWADGVMWQGRDMVLCKEGREIVLRNLEKELENEG